MANVTRRRAKKPGSGRKHPETSRIQRGRAGRPGAPGRSTASTAEDLAVEFHTLVRLALGEMGVTRAQQRRALARSQRLKSPPKISGRILRAHRGVAEILLEWSRKAPYLDSQGKPRILSVAGPGATFESLARRFLPDLRLEEVVSLACENADVITRPNQRIALVGSILVKLGDSRERYFAHAIRQFDQLLQTLMHNWHVQRQGGDQARMERIVSGIISRRQWNNFMAELRPQIYDLLLRIDSSIDRHRLPATRDLRDASAVSVSLYVGREDDLDRAGVSSPPATVTVPLRKATKRSAESDS